jgi:hypothetical protein
VTFKHRPDGCAKGSLHELWFFGGTTQIQNGIIACGLGL